MRRGPGRHARAMRLRAPRVYSAAVFFAMAAALVATSPAVAAVSCGGLKATIVGTSGNNTINAGEACDGSAGGACPEAAGDR